VNSSLSLTVEKLRMEVDNLDALLFSLRDVILNRGEAAVRDRTKRRSSSAVDENSADACSV